MKKCDCWHEEQYWDGWETNIMGRDEPKVRKKCVCWGTKEQDVCSCGADRTKCDFYPEVRAKAKEEERAQLDKMELKFYRYYLQKNDLVWDAVKEYDKWKKNKKEKKK